LPSGVTKASSLAPPYFSPSFKTNSTASYSLFCSSIVIVFAVLLGLIFDRYNASFAYILPTPPIFV